MKAPSPNPWATWAFPEFAIIIVRAQSLSRVPFLATLWTIALWSPLSVGFSRQEYWSGLSCPPSGDHPDPGNEPASMFPALGGEGLYH